jgi:O-antigen ligase
MLVGAFAALTERHVALLKAYVVGATALAVLWPFAHGLGQKNPTGQMIANAILLLIGYRPLRRYALCVLGLVPGLVFTGSRGAILALVVGLIVILAFQRSRSGAMLGRVAVVLVLSFAVYSTLPVSLQTRLTTLTPGVGSPGAYSLYVRSQYARDAEQIIKAHPWVGIGVGNYLAGNSLNGTQAQDPHDVLLLQAAEGGYLLAASFVVLIALVVLALKRMREVDVAAAAAGVMVATVAHGLVDVYWVRGTPMLSWLLVGMVCGGFMRSREQPEAPAS